MAYSHGEKYVLAGKESTWGTSVTADKDLGLIQDVNTRTAKTLMKSYGLGDVEVQQILEGKYEHGGTITAEFQHGRLLEWLFGAVAHDDTDTPDIKHTYSKASTLPSFTVEDGHNSTSDTTLTYEGVKAVMGRITVPGIDEAVRISVDFLAEDMNTGSTGSAAVLSSLEVLHGSQASFKIAGTAATEVQNAEFTVNRLTSANHGIGSQTPTALKSNEFSMDFSATLGFNNADEADRILSSAGFDIELDVDNGTTAGSGKRQLYVKLENCRYDKHEVSGRIKDYVYVDISGSGIFNTSYSYDNITSTNW